MSTVHRRRRVQGGVVRRGRGGQQPPRDRPARRLGRRDARQGARQRRRDRRGRVPRARRRHRHAWARRSAPGSTRSPTHGPEHLLAGARAYNRWAAELCQESPERRAGLIVAPILDDLDGAIAEIRRAHADGPHRRHHHPAAVGRPRVVHELPLRPGVGGVRGARSCRCTATPVPARTRTTARSAGWMSVYGYETIFFTARPLWFMLLTGVFERFPRLKMAVTEAGSFWAADLLWRVDMMATREHGMRKMVEHARHPHDAAERVLRPQRARSARRTPAGASSAVATRSASATSCGATTSRTPRARGRTRASS